MPGPKRSSACSHAEKGELMRCIKMFGLVGIAAIGLMALIGTGTASAAGGVLCSTATYPCNSKWANGTVLDFSLKGGASAEISMTNGTLLDKCTTSRLKSTLNSNPDAEHNQATSTNTELTWGNCSVLTSTLLRGKLRFESKAGGNGTVFADDEIEFDANVFEGCFYRVAKDTDIGVIVEGLGAGAELAINTV